MSPIRGPRWGWHQLDSRLARRVVADAGVVPGDLVLDVRAGIGAITGALVAAARRVVAIELTPEHAAYLRNQFDQRDVTVVRPDAFDLRLPRRPFKVVPNPPLGITTSTVKRLVNPGSRLTRAGLLVPWHAAERWSSRDPPGRGRWDSDFMARLGRRDLDRRFVLDRRTTSPRSLLFVEARLDRDIRSQQGESHETGVINAPRSDPWASSLGQDDTRTRARPQDPRDQVEQGPVDDPTGSRRVGRRVPSPPRSTVVGNDLAASR